MIAAIVPAAGRSERMGRPKLTLPVAGGGTVIDRVIAALRRGGVAAVVVVGPPLDAPGSAELFQQAADAGALAIPVPSPTEDMRSTVEVGLDFLDRSSLGARTVLIAPGDSVGLSAGLIASVVSRAKEEPESIVVPVFEGQRGHPLALPAEVARSIRELPPGVGINALRDRFADRVVLLDVPDPGTTADLDTPDDYRRWSPE
ncbi:nucleotidyltransferase family protein [Tautonia sociabilis]|uniref:MobA-like protein n=1 Tax=Tautonia sociabilis TaxID=2080755 RepID=A0A432MKD9_9BACT|nr:NTP transferase domain-containing protein [Tautonia sociabilis]RUL87883.1 MobA-like protein [Tautonia sociabilis]